MADARETLITLLEGGWTAGNTDSKTPIFYRVEEKKRLDFNENQDQVIMQVERGPTKPSGIGVASRDIIRIFDVDVRVQGDALNDQYAHYIKVVAEIERIMGANIIHPDADWSLLHPDGDRVDRSDGYRNMWRMLMTIKFERFNKAR